jgi:hypothetical protein
VKRENEQDVGGKDDRGDDKAGRAGDENTHDNFSF